VRKITETDIVNEIKYFESSPTRKKQFLGNVWRQAAEKLSENSDRRYYLEATEEFLMDWYRLDLICLFLNDGSKPQKYHRSYLLNLGIRFFVNWFEDLLIKNKAQIPDLKTLIDAASTNKDIRYYADELAWRDAEQTIIKLLAKEPPQRNDPKFKRLDKNKFFWTRILFDVLKEGDELNKRGKKISRKHRVRIVLLKRLLMWLESNLEEEI